MKKVIIGLVTVFCLLTCTFAREAVIKITIGHGVPEETAEHLGFVKFKEILESESNGRFQVTIYPNQQLGGDRELTESVQLGNLTITGPSSAPLASFDNNFYVLDIPFLFSNRKKVYQTLDGPAGKALLDSLDQYNLKGLGYMENGFRNLTNSRHEITSPTDLTGLKLRTMENEVHIAFWKLLGANPAPLAFGELYTALQQKVVDAEENPFELIRNNKLYEVQKYITVTRHIYSPYVVVINKQFYNHLSTSDKTLIDHAMKRAIDYQRRQAEILSDKAKETIRNNGNVITDLTPEQLCEFRTKVTPVINLVRKKAGDQMVDMFLSDGLKHGQ